MGLLLPSKIQRTVKPGPSDYTRLPSMRSLTETSFSTLSFLTHLCHLAEVKAWPGAGQNIWVMAPLQARFAHVTGLRVAPRQRGGQIAPRGGWCAAG